MTRGMEVCVGFGFKGWELNEIETLTCPDCAKPQEIDNLSLYEAIDQFHDSGVIPPMSCPLCNVSCDIRAWASKPRLTFTYLGFAFWNWPPLTGVPADEFNSAGEWSLNIPKLMSDAVGNPIAFSAGRL